MEAKYKKLTLRQLDETLKELKPINTMTVPPKGWVRAIRDALGMSARQLATRLGVNRPRVTRIERDEKQGRLTLKTMQNVAEALGCKFVYGFVPKTSLKDEIRTQARRVAIKRMQRSNQMMRFEAQELSDAEKKKMLDELIDEIVDTMPRYLWDE
jgi:predicted DNA-binding mobile mystery protein A